MTDHVASVAYEARDLAKEAKAEIISHEEVCAERYKGINEKLQSLSASIKWAGGTAVTIVIALLAFLLKAQYDNMSALQNQVQVIAQQQAAGGAPLVDSTRH